MSQVQKNKDKWINVDPRTKKLSIRFRVRGFSRQFYLSTGLKDNKTNRDLVKARVEIIERDIALNRFDDTLESYKFGNYKKLEPQTQTASLSSLWDDYLIFQSQHLEKSTLNSIYRNTTKFINNLPTQLLDAAAIRNLLLEKYSYHTAQTMIVAISNCYKWAVNSGLVESNPFEKIQLPRQKKRSDKDSSTAYTLDQRDVIISAFESHPKFSHYANIIKFLFWTGCRPGEAFALTWGDISPDFCRISINKAYASRVHVLKGTKNGKRRIFSCNSDSRLSSLLADLTPLHPNPSDIVFRSKTGSRMNLRILTHCWYGNYSNGRFYKGVVTELAQSDIVPYLKVYSTRHTFATWAIASGATPEKVAYWIGDNLHTVLMYYCHPDVTRTECPDF